MTDGRGKPHVRRSAGVFRTLARLSLVLLLAATVLWVALPADAIRIRAGPSTWRGVTTEHVDVTLGGVRLGAASPLSGSDPWPSRVGASSCTGRSTPAAWGSRVTP